MISIDPKELDTKQLHKYLLSSVGPRPIALASTIDGNGQPNLSPFSFFNVFSANPPIAIFSPARRVRDNTTKHTLNNVSKIKEVVINVVTYSMIEQTSLSSSDYKEGVNEFIKAGFTPIKSDLIRPFRVKESPVQMECSVKEIIPLGDKGGAGNLVVCEIIKIHVSEQVLDSNHQIDPQKINLVGRIGGNWYSKTSDDAIFEIEKPNQNTPIGYDKIPPKIQNSVILSANDIGKLAGVNKLPSKNEIEGYKENRDLISIFKKKTDGKEISKKLHLHAKKLLEHGNIIDAWKTLLIDKLN